MAMISKLGNDAIGDNYMENFAEVNMNTANVGRTDDASTGAAAIIVDGDGNNAIAVVMGANNLLTLEDVEAARPTIAAAKLYVSLAHASLCAAALRVVSFAVVRRVCSLVCQLEIPREVTLAAMRIAREEGTMTFLNTAPAPADGLDEEFIQLAVRAIAAPAPRTPTALTQGVSTRILSAPTSRRRRCLPACLWTRSTTPKRQRSRCSGGARRM